MEKHQRQFLKENLPKLIKKTNCTEKLLAILLDKSILSQEDINDLNSIQHERAQVGILYDLMEDKGISYEDLQHVMQEAGQLEACSILVECEVENIFRYRSISYKRSLLVGAGYYGSNVYQGSYEMKNVAVKKIYHDHITSKSLMEGQVRTLMKSKSDPHEKVVRYFEAEYGDEFILIAMELSATNLDHWVRKKSSEIPFDPLDLLSQIADGVAHLHSRGIIHGNLHPANVLISLSGENSISVRLSDFGMISTIKCDGNKRDMFLSGFGTGKWTAPEVIRYVRGDSDAETMDNSADIFSLGCLFYYILTGGKHPFSDGVQQMGNILNGNATLSESELTVIDMNALGFIWLIRQMLSQMKMERPPARAILSHPVFWSNAKIAQFLHDVHPFVEKLSVILDNCAAIVTRTGAEPGMVPGHFDVIEKYISHLGHPKEIKLSSLLKLIHEMGHPNHSEELPTEIATDYPSFWLSKFPFVMPVTWTVFQIEDDENLIQNYYQGKGTFKFNLVRKSGSSFEIFPLPPLLSSEENRCAFLGYTKAVFKSKLKEQIPLDAHGDDTPVYHEAFIQERFAGVQSEMLDDIHVLLSNENDDEGNIEFKTYFHKHIDSTLRSYLTKNKEHGTMAADLMDSVVTDLVSSFREQLEETISKFSRDHPEDYDVQVEEAFQNCRSTQLQSFQLTKNLHGQELYIQYLENLEKNMASIFAELKKMHSDRVQPEKNHEEDINQYEIKLNQIAQDGRGLSEAGLRMIHSLKVESVICKLEHSHPPQVEGQDGPEIKAKLLDKLHKIYDTISAIVGRRSTSSESATVEEDHRSDDEDDLDKLMLNPDPNLASDRPLQILHFFPEEGPHQKQLKVNHENLDFVLDQAKDLPVCIISICGPARQGKSFLMSCLVRHLEGMENGKEAATPEHSKSRPLLGFDFGSDSSKATKGFWMWSRPFIVNNQEGDEIAVLLMDTQGLDSEFTTARDSSIIAGMSLLASSVVIFNLFHTLHEHDLVALNNYTQYGIQALEKADEHGFPFQKLMFLIRDWNAPSEFPHGSVGGKSYLEEKLMVKDLHPVESKFVRTAIQDNFENLDCFLMPHIGKKGLHRNFNGSIDKMNRRFASQLRECLTGMINHFDIPVKKILGCEITASEFKASFIRYADVVNSSNLTTPGGTWLLMPQQENKNPIATAIQKYLEISNIKKPSAERYITNEIIGSVHRAARIAAFRSLKQELSPANPDLEAKLSERLHTNLESQFAHITRQVEESNKKFISKTVDNAGEEFRMKLRRHVPLEVDGVTEFYEDHLIRAAAETAQNELFNSFSTFPDQAQPHLAQLLEERFQTILNFYLVKNSIHRKKATNIWTSAAAQTYSNFVSQAERHFKETKFDDDDAKFFDEFQDFKSTHLSSFEKTTGLPKSNSFHQKLTELGEQMDEAIAGLREKHKLVIKKFQQDTEKFFNYELAEYEDKLRAATWTARLEEAAIRKIHSYMVHNTLYQFLQNNPFPTEHSKTIELENRLNAALQQVLDNVAATRFILMGSKEPIIRKESYPVPLSPRFELGGAETELYDDEMHQVLNAAGFMTEKELEREHRRIRDDVMEKLEKSTEPDLNNKKVNEIDIRINLKYQTFKELSIQKQRAAEKACINYVEESKNEYSRLIENAVLNLKEEKELDMIHEQVKLAVSKTFKDSCTNWDAQFTEPFVAMLEAQVEEVHQEIKDVLKLKIAEDDNANNQILLEASDKYHEEMDKHFRFSYVFTPDQLSGIHDEVKNIVIKNINLDRTTPLTNSQELELRTKLDNFLAKYQNINYMNANSDQMSPAIGIDLGTTYCCVAVYYRGKVQVIPNSIQNIALTTPSYIAYDPMDGDVTYGWPAKHNAYKNPEYTIYDTKRIIGRQFADPGLQTNMKSWPFTVKEGEDGTPQIMISETEQVAPEQVSGKLLTELRKLAEIYLELEPGAITKAVITVPAYFNDEQRNATRAAGELAGLEVLDILNEPSAAVLSYSLDRLANFPRKVLVYDLGGGTFDLAILEVTPSDINILGLNWDSHLGGEDFDRRIMEYCVASFKAEVGIDLLERKDAELKSQRDNARRRLRRLQKYCETAKQELSTARQTKVTVDGIVAGLTLSVTITKEKFEELNMDYFQKTIDLVDETLTEIGLRKEDITDVVLVGGSSRIPKVQELLEEYFCGMALNRWIHPDHIVAHGAAIMAAVLNGKKAGISDPEPLTFGSGNCLLEEIESKP